MKKRRTATQVFVGLLALVATATAMSSGARPWSSHPVDGNTVAALDAKYQEAVKKE